MTETLAPVESNQAAEAIETAPPPRLHRVPPGSSSPRLVTSPVEHTSPVRIAIVRASRALTAFGVLASLLLAYEFLLSGIPHGRTQAALLTAFKQQVPTTTLDSPASAPPEGSAVALIDIPSLGVQQVVVEGSTPNDLKSGPGHLRATPLPGEFGNSVIAGRRTTYGAPFGDLNRLRSGDAIQVTTGQGSVVYLVSQVEHVAPGQPDPISGTLDSRLTLLTSDPPYIANGRLAVVAKLRGAPLAVATRPTVPTGTGDLGLSGDPVGLGLGLIWLELLGTAAWLAWRLRHRFPRSVLYMFAAPVMLTLALLAFSSLDSLLPGTM